MKSNYILSPWLILINNHNGAFSGLYSGNLYALSTSGSGVRVFVQFWVIGEFSFYQQALKGTGGRDKRGYFNSEGVMLNCRFLFNLAGLPVGFFFFYLQSNMVSLKPGKQRAWLAPWIVIVSWSQCGYSALPLCNRSAPQYLEIGPICKEGNTKAHWEVWSITTMFTSGVERKAWSHAVS